MRATNKYTKKKKEKRKKEEEEEEKRRYNKENIYKTIKMKSASYERTGFHLCWRKHFTVKTSGVDVFRDV